MINLETAGAEQTKLLAAVIAGLCDDGDLVCLNGDLGAGKTAFAQGFGAALGVVGPITSPTFALVQHYEGSEVAIHHVDAYRVSSSQEAFELALPEILEDGGIMVIEWASRLGFEVDHSYLAIDICLGTGDDDRLITIQAVGSRWHERKAVLAEVLAPWESASQETN